MRFGLGPYEVSKLAAEAAVAADLLYRQTGDPLDRLTLVQDAQGYWTTETVRNQQMRQSAYSQNKTRLEQLAFAAAGLVGVGILVWWIRR